MKEGLVGLEIEEQGDVVVARLTGELDIAGSAPTGERITDAVPTSAGGLVVDLMELDFIDSSGIAMLFGLARRLGSRRQKLSVAAPAGGPVWRVLEIVEFERAAPVRPDVEAAVADIS